MRTADNKFKIAVIGPESTGKTELSLWLANELKGDYYPELARDYIENLGREYEKSDLDIITQLQVEQYDTMLKSKNRIHVFDTELIITKIWYEWVYKLLPIDFIKRMYYMQFDLYLLCFPDIPWFPDLVRENGGEARNQLFDIYKSELEYFGYTYGIVSGLNNERRQKALNIIKLFIKDCR
ncbi:MAG: AAA family ATPase [Salinivirgaceae bacterium]|jgi:nicotinamide riboside kinase|nr:ATP-binding protein [Bacteroidales bacterium]